MADVTVIIPTYNEEQNIAACIKSLDGFAEKIIIMDYFSTDKTKSIAESLGAKVIQSEKSYKDRLNTAIEFPEITTKWIFNIDADERLTEKSRQEFTMLMEKYKDDDNVNGIVSHYYFVFMDKLLKWGFHPYKMRTFKKGTAYMENVELDEQFVLKRGKCVKMKSYIVHYDFKGMDKFITKLNGFSQRAAHDYIKICNNEKGVTYEGLAPVHKFRRFMKYNFFYKLPIVLRSWLYYVYYYYFNLGFLDGTKGKIFQFMYIYWYKFLTDAYMVEEWTIKKNDSKVE